MNSETTRRIALSLAIVASLCVALSLIWSIPYIFTLLGLAAWTFIGHLVTADDDAPGGWSNPDGKLPFPWAELGIKLIVLVLLCSIAMAYPTIRSLGGSP